ncbi:hypothetical protein KR093_003710 [Drosophila rubida]|uniref:Uncharacterized protein n=1 Tax=Drosophila rubida TaxID=30044 RepID=A0AAD4KCM0_9MUSC|nr:hypothetical protein KR093_003710 [Drosophila rubida]
MGCCASSLKSKNLQRTFDGSASASSKRSRSSTSSSVASASCSTTSSSGVGSACSTQQRSQSRSSSNRSQATSMRPICDDFAEQPTQVLDRSYGYHTCSSDSSTPSQQQQLRRTQDMENISSRCSSSSSSSQVSDTIEAPFVGNLEWEMFMIQQSHRIMCKTSSPIGQRRALGLEHDANSRAYHKWRNYLQNTPVHMLHNVTHIPEAIAGQFCPTDFPGFSDLDEMESAAKRYKVDRESSDSHYGGMQPQQQLQQLTHTISTDL